MQAPTAPVRAPRRRTPLGRVPDRRHRHDPLNVGCQFSVCILQMQIVVRVPWWLVFDVLERQSAKMFEDGDEYDRGGCSLLYLS